MSPGFFLADGDWLQIIAALLFFLISGVVQWLQKRSRAQRGLPPLPEEAAPWSDPWGRSTPSTTDTPENVRDIIPTPRPRTVGSPSEFPRIPPSLAPAPQGIPYQTEEFTAFDEKSLESADAPTRRLASLPGVDSAHRRAAQIESDASSRLHRASNLSHAHSAIESSSRLQQQVASRLHGVAQSTLAPAPSTAALLGSSVSPEARRLSETLRNPATARDALLASFVLQPPKGLEPH